MGYSVTWFESEGNVAVFFVEILSAFPLYLVHSVPLDSSHLWGAGVPFQFFIMLFTAQNHKWRAHPLTRVCMCTCTRTVIKIHALPCQSTISRRSLPTIFTAHFLQAAFVHASAGLLCSALH